MLADSRKELLGESRLEEYDSIANAENNRRVSHRLSFVLNDIGQLEASPGLEINLEDADASVFKEPK